MKTTGIIRKIDELGRLVLPIEMRRTLELSIKDPVEIYVEGDTIILRKHRDGCLFCGSNVSLLSFQDKQVCSDCLRKLNELA